MVQAPTLVIHPRDLKLVPADVVREFTDLIPGARLREIPGDAAVAFALDVELIADIVEEFATVAPAPPTNRILATVLFTDLVRLHRARRAIGHRNLGERAQPSPLRDTRRRRSASNT